MNWIKQVEEQGLLVLEPRNTFDRAIIGITSTPDDHWPRQTDTACVVYSIPGCIAALMEDEGCDYEEAWEFISYNTMNAWMGEGTPTFEDEIPDHDESAF